MNIREAATYLTDRGYRCSASTVRNLARADEIPCFRPGVTRRGRREFTAEQLDRFLAKAECGGRAKAPATRPRIAPPRVASTPVAQGPPVDRLARLKAERGT